MAADEYTLTIIISNLQLSFCFDNIDKSLNFIPVLGVLDLEISSDSQFRLNYLTIVEVSHL